MTILIGNPFIELYYAVKSDIDNNLLDPNKSRFKLNKDFVVPALMPLTDRDIEYPIIVIKLIDISPSPLGAGDFIKEEYTKSRVIEGFKYDVTVWVGIYTKKDIMYKVDWEGDGNVTEIGYNAFNEYLIHEIIKATNKVKGNISNISFNYIPNNQTITTGYSIDESRLLSEISFKVELAAAEYYTFNEDEFIEIIISNVNDMNDIPN